MPFSRRPRFRLGLCASWLVATAGLALRCAQGEELTASWKDEASKTTSGVTTGPSASGATSVGGTGVSSTSTGGTAATSTGTGSGASSVGAGGSAAGRGVTAGTGGISGAGGASTGAGGSGGNAGAASGTAGTTLRDAGRDVGGGGSAGAGGDASMCSQGCTIKVQYQNDVTPAEPMTSTVRVRVDVLDAGIQSVRSSDVTVRYWFTDPGGVGDKVTCYFTQGGCSDITTRFVAVEPARRGADRYLEIAFTAATTLAPGDHTGTISLGIQHTSSGGALYDQTDDYSYAPNRPALVDWPNITAYVGKTLVWGVEP